MIRTLDELKRIDRTAQSILLDLDPGQAHIARKGVSPAELWSRAMEYFKSMTSTTWSKSEVIKGGDMAGEVINVPVSSPLTVHGFCVHAGIGHRTFYRYLGQYVDSKDKEGTYDAYIEIANLIKDIITADQVTGAMLGAYDPRLTMAIASIAERKEITGKDGGAIDIKQITGMIVK